MRRFRDENRPFPEGAFEGAFESEASKWSEVRIESLGRESLCNLRTATDWPLISQWRPDGLHATLPRNALARAAVTVTAAKT